MKKKFMAMTLGLVMALSLVACGGGSDSGSSTTKETAAAESGDSTNTGSNTVVVAMGAGFSTLDPGYTYEKYPPVISTSFYQYILFYLFIFVLYLVLLLYDNSFPPKMEA